MTTCIQLPTDVPMMNFHDRDDSFVTSPFTSKQERVHSTSVPILGAQQPFTQEELTYGAFVATFIAGSVTDLAVKNLWKMRAEGPSTGSEEIADTYNGEPLKDPSIGAVRLSLVELALEESCNALEAELQRGDEADSEKLYQFAMRIIRLQMLRAGRQDHEYAVKKTKELDECVKNLQGTYNDKWSIAFTTLSAALSLFGGLGCFSTLAGNRLGGGFEAFSKSWAAGGTALSTGGQAVGSFSKIFDEKNQSQRTLYQHLKDTGQSKQSSAKEDLQKKSGQADAVRQQETDAMQRNHQTFSEMVR